MGLYWKRTTFRSPHRVPTRPSVVRLTPLGSTSLKGAPSRAPCRRARAISAARRHRSASRAHRYTDGRQNMAYRRFLVGLALRTAALALTIVAAACLIAQTRWYVTFALCLATAFAQIAGLVRFATQSSREVARFL